MCYILRRIFAVSQLAYVDNLLRCSVRKWASAQEIAFRRVHGFIGIPLKVGKEDVSQCIEALGHITAAQQLWAGLRMTDKRRESVLLRVSTALVKGLGAKEVEEITGHPNFALMATAGKTMFSFARTLYDAVPGPIGKQKPQVYRALLWLEAVLQNPPPRVERDQHDKHHVLLPDGYWDPDKQQGGVGAVFLREGATPFTYGGMIPPHLSYVLLSMQEEAKEKKQRNTQAELLAILMAILMWHDDLRGNSLLILTDSTAALENVKAGVPADQQSRDIVAHIQFFAMIYRISFWFDWVPSKQNPGDPYSRPCTCSEEAKELDKLLGATRFEPVWPSFLRASPTAWRAVMCSPSAPSTWSTSKQIHALVELGVARPEEFGIALLHLVNPDKAIVLRMGDWPRSRPCGKNP